MRCEVICFVEKPFNSSNLHNNTNISYMTTYPPPRFQFASDILSLWWPLHQPWQPFLFLGLCHCPPCRSTKARRTSRPCVAPGASLAPGVWVRPVDPDCHLRGGSVWEALRAKAHPHCLPVPPYRVSPLALPASTYEKSGCDWLPNGWGSVAGCDRERLGADVSPISSAWPNPLNFFQPFYTVGHFW